MNLGEAQVTSRGEWRRSERSPLSLPLAVRGVSLDTRPFQEDTFTLSISAHGALIALATTVTLGQTLILRNSQTQNEAKAWVTRFGLTRGARTQVGIEFVQPDPEFWTAEGQAGPPTDGSNGRSEQQAKVWPNPDENAPPEPAAPYSDATVGPTLPDILMRALEQTLQQAAEQVVAAATTARLGAAVNQAAEAVENFSSGKIRQIEERLAHYHQELVTSAHEEFLSLIKADIAQTEERLRNRAAEILEGAASAALSDFTERLRETSNRTAAEFGEEAAGSSAQHLANFAEQVQASVNEARSQIDHAAMALTESQEKVRVETDRAVTEVQQKVESLTSQSKEVYSEWETHLHAFREELAHTAEQEIGRFREHLQSGLSSLFSSLG